MTETIFDIDFSFASESDSETENEVEVAAPEPVVAVDTNSVTQEAAAAPVLQLYGGNKKKILFIVNKPGVPFFSKDAELAFLKTLAAMNLALADVLVVNVASFNQQIGFEFIQNQLSPAYWVFLGTSPTSIKLGEYPENSWSPGGGSQVLRTYSFDEMLTDVEKKRVFWNAVKLINN